MKNTYPLSCVGPYSNTMNKTTLLSFLKHLAEIKKSGDKGPPALAPENYKKTSRGPLAITEKWIVEI